MMHNLRPAPAPESRSHQSQMQDLRRKAAYLEAAVAIAIILSICALAYAITGIPAAVAWKTGALV